ncbi:membrane protein [Klebsiella aerogenes]|nr:membrane protein [Klebsiella aerogenes]
MRKRKENKRDLLHSVNTNENHYQFDAVLILLCSVFVIDVLEKQCG